MELPQATKKDVWGFLYVGILAVVVVCVSITAIFLGINYLNAPSSNFPVNAETQITEGMNQNDITHLLEDRGVVRSALYLYLVLTAEFKGSFAQAGAYEFPEPLTTHGVARAITTGQYRSPLVTVTLPEGFKANDLFSFFPDSFNDKETPDLAQYEGYLFPDTYYISTNMRFDDIVTLLRANFDVKLGPYKNEILQSGYNERDVVILASILEREAKDINSKKIVSGILQNRLRVNMPLQVDAVFNYILNKTSRELTDDDMNLDSPYNTYLHTGLPPTPISNPGLEAVEAVLEPTRSEYLYYLTDSDGNFHYARTFEEHKKNKAKYLE